MNFVATPSLEHLALVKTTTALWIQDDIRSKGNFVRGWWDGEENRIFEKVPVLQLPKSLEIKVLNFVNTIGLEIRKWMLFHEFLLSEGILHREILNKLYWTSQGTIDKKKTAEILTRNDKLDITLRYTLACIYCLDNDIRTLWNKVLGTRRLCFYCVEDPRCVRQPELVVFWTYYIKGELAKMGDMIKTRTPYQYAFEIAAVSGNKVATEYFLRKLNPKEREESLVKYAGQAAYLRSHNRLIKNTDFPKDDYADVLCFLLSQMYEEQQIEVFRDYPREVLKCLLDWPWQSFFIKTVIQRWEILPQKEFHYLLVYIVDDKIKKKHKDCNYQGLFMEFWQLSPITHKRYVIEWNCHHPSLIIKLIEIEAAECIKLILDFAYTTEREKIILSFGIKNTCEHLIYYDRWGKLKLFVQECISSKDILIKFKDMMTKMKDRIMEEREGNILVSFRHYEITPQAEKEIWIQLFQLLDDLIQKSDKRSMEDVNSGKRRCLESE